MLAGGTATAQFITIATMPVVTRLYTPGDLGVATIFLSFFGFWASNLSLRYEYAILIARDDLESHVIRRLGFILVLAMSVIGFPMLIWLRQTDILGFGLLPQWVPFVASPILAGYGLFMVNRAWALRGGLVREITNASVSRAVAGSASQIILGVFSAGVVGLFAAQLVASWSAMMQMGAAVGRHFLPSKPYSIGLDQLLAAAGRYKKFPVLEAPSAWIDQLGMLLPIPMIASLHGAAAAGWYGLARMIISIPNSQIGNAVADVFQVELASALASGDAVRARLLFWKFARNLALGGFFPFAIIAVSAVSVVPWIFGAAWREAGVATALIAPWAYFSLMVSPLSRLLSVLRAQELKLIYDITAVLLLATAFGFATVEELTFHQTVLAISAAQIVGYLIYIRVLAFAIANRFPCAARKICD